MPLDVLDGTGAQQNMSTTLDASGYLVGSTCVTDPSSGAKQRVSTDHSSDGNALPNNSALVASVLELFNGVTYDRERGNMDTTTAILNVSSQTANVNSSDQTNYNGRGVQLGINITALTGTTPTVTVSIQGKDVVSGQYYTLGTSAALNATGFTVLTLYPGVNPSNNVAFSQVLPRTWRVAVTLGGTSPSTNMTVGASIIR